MSDALEALRAIEAISMTLAERMALVLRDVPDIERSGVRRLAYSRAGICLGDYTIDEENKADGEAYYAEWMRRNP